MKIAFATAALPDSGTAVVLAADTTLGATAAELDRRTGGALSRAIELAGGKLKRGRAVELLCPAGVGLGRVVVLGVGAPGEAKRLDLEVLGGSLAVKLKALGVAEASVAVDAIEGLPFGRRSLRSASPRAPCCAAIASTSTAPARTTTRTAGTRSRS